MIECKWISFPTASNDH